MLRIRRASSLALWGGLLFFSFTTHAQSPWPRSKAGFYVQAAWNFIPGYDALFGKNGANQPLDRRLSENTFQLYGEYGLTKRTTLITALPIRVQQAGHFLANTPAPQTSSGALTGLGNVSLAIRHRIWNKDVPLTATLRVDAPASAFDEKTGLRTGYDALSVLPMLSTGMGLRRAYWFVYAGYGVRGIWQNQFLNTGAEAGMHWRNTWLIGFSELLLFTGSKTYYTPPVNYLTGMFVPDQGYWSFGLKAIYEFNRFWGITASAAGAGWGQYVPKRPGLGIGGYFKWD